MGVYVCIYLILDRKTADSVVFRYLFWATSCSFRAAIVVEWHSKSRPITRRRNPQNLAVILIGIPAEDNVKIYIQRTHARTHAPASKRTARRNQQKRRRKEEKNY